MKRVVRMALVVVVLIGCSSPAVTPTVKMVIDMATWTPEAPKAATATDEATFTPIPPTFTLTAKRTATSTKTATATKTSTVTKTRTLIRTAGPTRTSRPTAVPTIFLPPTNTPEVVIVPPTNTPEVIVIPPTNTPEVIAVPPTNPPAQACCKVCTNGKACGNSCISSSKTCHQPPGCACNG